MTIPSVYVALATTAFLVSFGTSKLLAQVHLATWEILSAGHSDIAARGVWLLAVALPQIAAISVVGTTMAIVVLTRRAAMGWPGRLVSGFIGSVIGAAFVAFGADPTALGLGLLRWPSALSYHLISAAVGVVLVVLGTIATRRVVIARKVSVAAV
jgi:hypothetical protein